MLVIKSPVVSNRPGLQKLRRDALLSGDNDGVRFLFDLGFKFSWPGGAPASGAGIRDMAEIGDGTFVLASGQTVGFNGNGFDFSTLSMTENTTYDENHIKAPADVWGDIYEHQQFLWCMYVKLPTESDFNGSSTIYPMFASSSDNGGYGNVADPLTVAQRTSSGNKQLIFRRQTGVGTVSDRALDATGHYGKFCQLAYWRNAEGVGARLISSAGTVLSTNTAGSDNSADFSACQARFGAVAPFSAYGTVTEHRTARNFRLYRGFIENLARSGRDPVEVLDADYARTIARGVFS